MSYLHHYPMLIEVPGMIEDTTIGLSHEKLAAALRAMADRIEEEKPLLQNIIGRGPINAEMEDRWVRRAADRPGVICKAAGGWVFVDSVDIDLEDTVTGEVAAGMLAKNNPTHFENSVWCRPEDIGGIAIVAELRDQRFDKLFRCDLTEFIAKGDKEDVGALFSSGWRSDCAWPVLRALEEAANPAGLAMSDHLEMAPDHPDDKFPPFVIELQDKAAATSFLKDCRPDLYESLIVSDRPEI